MGYSIKDNILVVSKNLEFTNKLFLSYLNGNRYFPNTNDEVLFTLRKKGSDTPLVSKVILNSLSLEITLEDVKQLGLGEYVYDMKLTTEHGVTDEFISGSTLYLVENAYTIGGSMYGKLSFNPEQPSSGNEDCVFYNGEYEVDSSVNETHTLPTANKHLEKNIVLNKIKYDEISNNANGITVYIGG